MAVLSVSCTISLDLPLKNTCPRYTLIMLSIQHHLCKRLNKVGMKDLLELSKKSCEPTILSNSKSNTRRMERGIMNTRWCTPQVARGWRWNIA
jgi:hypothetical protein